MEIVTEEATIQCPDCTRTFKSTAGAGRHRTAMHGKTFAGKRVGKRRVANGTKPVTVSFEMNKGVVRIQVTPDDARKFLLDHPEETLEALLG